jgi:hypothetical protein
MLSFRFYVDGTDIDYRVASDVGDSLVREAGGTQQDKRNANKYERFHGCLLWRVAVSVGSDHYRLPLQPPHKKKRMTRGRGNPRSKAIKPHFVSPSLFIPAFINRMG